MNLITILACPSCVLTVKYIGGQGTLFVFKVHLSPTSGSSPGTPPKKTTPASLTSMPGLSRGATENLSGRLSVGDQRDPSARARDRQIKSQGLSGERIGNMTAWATLD